MSEVKLCRGDQEALIIYNAHFIAYDMHKRLFKYIHTAVVQEALRSYCKPLHTAQEPVLDPGQCHAWSRQHSSGKCDVMVIHKKRVIMLQSRNVVTALFPHVSVLKRSPMVSAMTTA